MTYAKVENGQVTRIGLPKTGTLSDGRTVSCYDKLPEDTLLQEGWLPYIDNPPEYDPETQYLEVVDPTITENEVVANYIVQQREIVTPEPTLEQKIADIQIALAELYGMGV